ncbi:hypothetical protein QFZ21_001875 [Microbacterium sp. W4I20]|nr:hypothetical protein [Microbacterium sp. W4I20]
MQTLAVNVGFMVWGNLGNTLMAHWGFLRTFTAQGASA